MRYRQADSLRAVLHRVGRVPRCTGKVALGQECQKHCLLLPRFPWQEVPYLLHLDIVLNAHLSLLIALPVSTPPTPIPPPTQSTSAAPPPSTSSKLKTRLPLPFLSPRSPPAISSASKTPPLISSVPRSAVPSSPYLPTSPMSSVPRSSPPPKPPILKFYKLSTSPLRLALRMMLAVTPSPPIRLSSSSILAALAAMPLW